MTSSEYTHSLPGPLPRRRTPYTARRTAIQPLYKEASGKGDTGLSADAAESCDACLSTPGEVGDDVSSAAHMNGRSSPNEALRMKLLISEEIEPLRRAWG